MEHLRRWYRPVSLHEIIEAFACGKALPRRAVHVTVDDAYRNFRDVVWPILRDLDIPVTLFVPTAYPGDPERMFWWDRLHRTGIGDGNGHWSRIRSALGARGLALPKGSENGRALRGVLRMLPHGTAMSLIEEAGLDLAVSDSFSAVTTAPAILGWDELRELKAEGVTFGAHTRHHVALPQIDPAAVRWEIRRSLDDLARELGEGPGIIAYPYGLCSATVARIAAEEGCVLGFTCEDGLNRPGVTDPLRLRRSNITRRTSPPLFAIRMLPWWAGVDRWRHRHERGGPIT